MRKTVILFFLVSLFAVITFGQSGRQAVLTKTPASPDSNHVIADMTLRQMFVKASNYARVRFSELELKKAPYSESVHRKVLREQKQLAAKYAGQAVTRENLLGDDLYYLGRLHWLATNSDDAALAFDRFLQGNSPDTKKVQTARSVVVVIAAHRKNFEKAEVMLDKYKKGRPIRMSEVAKMEKQLAHSYRSEKNLNRASDHAEEAFKATQILLSNMSSRDRALSQLLDSGITSFELQRELGNNKKAESVLATLRTRSIPVQSHGLYYRAVDEHIKFLIETNRKPLALKLYRDTLKRINTDFNTPSMRQYVLSRFKKRKKHYALLGEVAPSLVSIDKWIPNKPQNLSDLRGKVVLLDFWATWCGPCLEAFPSLIKWHQNHKDDGLVILGMTRYYGEAGGLKVDNVAEIISLVRFKKENALPYSFAVADGQANQIRYGAKGLPTAILIDRKGIVRYAESGNSDSREQEIFKMIRRLLAEK